MGNFDKKTEIDVPIENPFANDVFNRKALIEPLTQLICSMEKPFVLSVEAPWGHGKTTFIKMWKQYLLNKEKVALYYNAWENDYVEDPLSSLIISLSNQISSTFKDLRISDSFKNLLKLGGKLAGLSLPIILGALSRGIVDKKTIISFKGLFKPSDYEKLVSESSKQIISTIEEQVKANDSFSKNLNSISQRLKKLNKTPLVIFIDELDRCRPDFALSLLERIKHLFNVEGIIFILSLDRKQLNTSIKTIYGNELNSEEYLRRFIDLSFQLQVQKEKTREFINQLFSINDLEKLLKQRGGNINEYESIIYTFAIRFSFSLRRIENIVFALNIIIRSTPKIHSKYPSWKRIITLFLMQNIDPDLFKELISGSLSALHDFEIKLNEVIIELGSILDWSWLYAQLIPENFLPDEIKSLDSKISDFSENDQEFFLFTRKRKMLSNRSDGYQEGTFEINNAISSIEFANMFFDNQEKI